MEYLRKFREPAIWLILSAAALVFIAGLLALFNGLTVSGNNYAENPPVAFAIRSSYSAEILLEFGAFVPVIVAVALGLAVLVKPASRSARPVMLCSIILGGLYVIAGLVASIGALTAGRADVTMAWVGTINALSKTTTVLIHLAVLIIWVVLTLAVINGPLRDPAFAPAKAAYPYQPGYQQAGYPQGYPPQGYQQPGYQQPGYQQPGYPQQDYPQQEYPQGGYQPQAYPQPDQATAPPSPAQPTQPTQPTQPAQPSQTEQFGGFGQQGYPQQPYQGQQPPSSDGESGPEQR